MDDHSELLTYRVTPFSFSTRRPNCLWTSGEPLPNESVSDLELDTGLADSLIPPPPMFGESITELAPALVTLWAGPRRFPTATSSRWNPAEPASGEFPAL